MDINAYSVFLTAAEEMNFTRAAEKLHITQQSLSGYIQRLEKEYRVSLFYRKPTLRLTPEGEAMVYFARNLEQSEKLLASRFADLSKECMEIVRMGISRQRTRIFLPGIWNAYHAKYPNISLRLKESVTQLMVEDLIAGKLDIMVGLNIPRHSTLEVVSLVNEPNVCIVHESLLRYMYPEDWEARLEHMEREGVALLELKDFPFLIFSQHNIIRKAIDQIFHREHILPIIAMESNDQGLLLELASQGDGVAIITPINLYKRMKYRTSLPEGTHILRLLDLPENEICLALRRDEDRPQYLEALKEAIREECTRYGEMLEEAGF